MNPRAPLLPLIAICFVSFLSFTVHAQDPEIDRLSGFAKHHKDNNQYGKAREQGEKAFLEEEEQWENKKERELQDYKKQAKDRAMADEGKEFLADLAEKKKLNAQYEADKKVYTDDRAKKKAFNREGLNLPTESQELGLDEQRPRYDYRKRASFGATPKYGKNASSGSGRSSGGSGSYGGGGSSSPSFPPPPSFDDFQDGGYLPAPTLDNNEYMGDIPPPPPPPPPFDGGMSGESDFPPPPPPTFGEDPGDF